MSDVGKKNDEITEVEELKRRKKILQAQFNLLALIAHENDFYSVLNRCLKTALEISGLECGGIYLVDNDGGIELILSKGLSTEFINAVKYYPPHSEKAKIILSGKPLFLLYTSPNLPFKRAGVDDNLKAIAIVPIVHKNEIVGSFNIASRIIETIHNDVKTSIEAIASITGILVSRLRVEERLLESEENYKRAEKMAKLGHWRRSYTHEVAYWSKGTHEIFGTDPESFTPSKDNFYNAIHPSDLATVKTKVTTAIEKREPLDIEYRVMRPDGEIITVHSRAELKPDKKIKDMMLGTIQDITQFKKTEQELKNQKARLEEVNTALNVLIEHRENELNQLERNVQENLNKLVIPYLERANKAVQKQETGVLLEIAISNLKNIAKPFSRTLAIEKLSPTELQIADLVRNGKTTKEISEIMHVSTNTVMTHRYNIRKKLGLLRENTNLYTYLQTIQL